MNHLSDDLLYEYLDMALAPNLRTEAEIHLATCPTCTTRLDDFRSLFADIDSLPDLPLEVDFARIIVTQLEQNTPLPRPIRWLTIVQAFSALMAAFLIWPLIEVGIQPFSLPSLSNIFSELASSFLQTITDFRFPSISFELPSLNLNLSTATIILVMVSVSLLWLAANGLLLIPRSRRTS